VTITINRKKLLVLAALLAVALSVGGAVASWSTSGSGNASAKAATASAITLADASALTTGDLYPGGTGNVKLKISNPNSFPVSITSVTLTSGGTIASSSATCDSGGNGVTFTNTSGLSISLAANAVDQAVTLTGKVAMSTASVNACQGATFTIPVDVTAVSA
jgi:hypothetical protein